jgi:uncharacterized protein YebE (UPF0316 family)
MDMSIILVGLAIFFARIVDVSLGTIRTIAIVHGRTVFAFFLGVLEVSMWILVVSEVIPKVKTDPILIIFYATGFATGSVLGVLVERKLAFGNVVIKFISPNHGLEIAEAIRNTGQPVTVFHGDGMNGPVKLLYIACKRNLLARILQTAQKIEPEIFYTTETPGLIRKNSGSVRQLFTGWRAVMKKK